MEVSEQLLKAYLYIPVLADQSLEGLEKLGEWAAEFAALETALKDAEAANKSIETQAENYIYALKQEKIASEKREAGLRELEKQLKELIANSRGVDGFHMNGDLADWDWLIENELLSALKEPAEDGDEIQNQDQAARSNAG